MPKRPPTIYLIAGCNGSGKTTFAKEFLPLIVWGNGKVVEKPA
jgi:uridine kinase